MKRLILVTLAGLLTIYLIFDTFKTSIATSRTTIANNTLMIVNEHGGGTGVTLYSSIIASSVLTNRHVCEAIRHGGHVLKDSGEKFEIINFRESQVHDLCLILVSGNLNGGVTLASSAPAPYDDAIVSGHPHLMPTVIMQGHFTHKVKINIMMDPTPMEAQALSVLIGPGSSGSAVYNGRGELAGMVFAGMGMIGFAYIVPYEYISYFLLWEASTILPEVITSEPKTPDTTPPLTSGKASGIQLVQS